MASSWYGSGEWRCGILAEAAITTQEELEARAVRKALDAQLVQLTLKLQELDSANSMLTRQNQQLEASLQRIIVDGADTCMGAAQDATKIDRSAAGEMSDAEADASLVCLAGVRDGSCLEADLDEANLANALQAQPESEASSFYVESLREVTLSAQLDDMQKTSAVHDDKLQLEHMTDLLKLSEAEIGAKDARIASLNHENHSGTELSTQVRVPGSTRQHRKACLPSPPLVGF